MFYRTKPRDETVWLSPEDEDMVGIHAYKCPCGRRRTVIGRVDEPDKIACDRCKGIAVKMTGQEIARENVLMPNPMTAWLKG